MRSQRKPRHGWFDYEVLDIFGDQLGPYGITVYMVLARLCYGGFRVTMGLRELAGHARMSKSALARTLEGMKSLGLVVEHKGRTSKSVSSYDLTDVKDLVEALQKARAVAAQSVPARDSVPDGSATGPQDASAAPLLADLPQSRGDAPEAALSAAGPIGEIEPIDLASAPDSNCPSQGQMPAAHPETALQHVEISGDAPSPGTDLSLCEAVSGTDLSLPRARSNTQERRNKKQELKSPHPTLPAGEGAVEKLFPDENRRAVEADAEDRWAAFKTRLKREMHDVPIGVEAAKRWQGVEQGAHDFTACFSAWWLVRVERDGGGTVFFTEAGDEAATAAGVKKYRKRLARLAQNVFNLPKSEAVTFEVQRAPAPSEPEALAAGADGHEAPDAELWQRVQLMLREGVGRLAEVDPRGKLARHHHRYDLAIDAARLESVKAADGRPAVWRLSSPVPHDTREVMGLFQGRIDDLAGGETEIVVLGAEESP